ncbi:MAG: sigma-70 family RNA polymerase sigma factor [Bacteroidota bacterium]|nr:sigma-70 family RNA polymerase sigma factor [Bacteroidota bacterium]MDP4214003.1 sigma-70 family RNA polymerase sigma factor [Bacteroidota bacterium]MDP4250260.1 sigma-70 family RNA polymerase sigma factor [Bacteroidota bacterium]
MPLQIAYTEKGLLYQVSEGDEIAFRELFCKYKNRIYSIAFRLTRSAFVSEEVVQDIFLHIWIRRSKLSQVEDFDAYLFVTTRNEVYRTLKRIARQRNSGRPASEETDQFSADENLLYKDFVMVLQKAIERLPYRQRQIYRLIKEKELKRDQVAARLHLDPETVKSHLAQAMRNIRAYCLTHLDLFLLFLLISYFLFVVAGLPGC